MIEPRPPRWSLLLLLGVLSFQCVWRAHTFGDTPLYRPLINLGVAAGGTIEPLDCDEAIYGYMGHRMLRGDVLYRDLSENKPPLGYWLYALAVAIGGANEWAIRLMPYPFVLATTVLAWWVARRLGGDLAAALASFLFALASTDPYLFGNGANLEHAMNLFSVASLACYLKGRESPDRGWLVTAGALIGAECLIKQVAVLTMGLYVAGILLTPNRSLPTPGRAAWLKSTVADLVSICLGFMTVWLVALTVLLAQGALREGFEHFVTWALALARETPPDPFAPSRFVRWLTGNSDPRNGSLPWPFGRTDYLVWWGTGSWPLWLAAVPAVLMPMFGRSTTALRRFLAVWTLVTCFEVVMSGLYWQHYYLLPVPGLAISIGLLAGDCVREWGRRGLVSKSAGVVTALALILAIGWTVRIQVRDYLLVTPEQLTTRWKGGGQWVALRSLGLELKRRVALSGAAPTLFVWGWQSPLYFYGELDAPTPYAFADPLLKAFASSDHPLIRPRVERIVADLKAKPPTLIYVADLPFPALRAFLKEEYVVSYSGLAPWAPDGRGLYIRRDASPDFEAAGGRPLAGR